MCGRYALTSSPRAVAALLRVQRMLFEGDTRRYNIAPTQMNPVVRINDDCERELLAMHWGLIPSWAKDRSIGSRMINARSETAAEKPAFRAAMKQRRCIVPADGFFEWKKPTDRNGVKQPHFIHRADNQPLLLAGLWERWQDPESAQPLLSYTILTTQANAQLKPLHDRMPVILEPEDVDAWLDPQQHDAAALHEHLHAAADGILHLYPISTRVNTPRNDDPAIIEPLEQPDISAPQQDESSLFE